MERKSLKKFLITTGKYTSFLHSIIDLANDRVTAIVCVANVHMYIEAYKDQNFLRIINEAEIVTPDGKPLTWALRILYGVKQDRVAGMDMLPDLLRLMSLHKISVFFYGGTQHILDRTESYIKELYPDLKIAGLYSPPFRPLENFDNAIEEEIIEKINNSLPLIVFVVLGCPKQEKWMALMRGKINTVMIGIGGALPVLIGINKRAPKWMQNSGLEWFYRLMQEPSRLFKRYATTNRIFMWLMFKEYVRIKLFIPLGLSKAS